MVFSKKSPSSPGAPIVRHKTYTICLCLDLGLHLAWLLRKGPERRGRPINTAFRGTPSFHAEGADQVSCGHPLKAPRGGGGAGGGGTQKTEALLKAPGERICWNSQVSYKNSPGAVIHQPHPCYLTLGKRGTRFGGLGVIQMCPLRLKASRSPRGTK